MWQNSRIKKWNFIKSLSNNVDLFRQQYFQIRVEKKKTSKHQNIEIST